MSPSWTVSEMTAEQIHRYEVSTTQLRGVHSDRVRFRVYCRDCDKVAHKATTNPTWAMACHDEDSHNSIQVEIDNAELGIAAMRYREYLAGKEPYIDGRMWIDDAVRLADWAVRQLLAVDPKAGKRKV